LRCGRATALRALAGVVALTVVGQLPIVPIEHRALAPETPSLLLINLLAITTAWMLGYAVGQQRLYAAGLRAQEQQEIREQLAEARHTMAEERLRIARELHDVVAHSMSVIAVQAGVANHVAADQPREAHRALSSIEETSRGALWEMRALLGVLRDEQPPTTDHSPTDPSTTDKPAAASPVPAPRLADLAALVARTAEAGVQIDLTVSGQPPDLSPGLQLAAFRVVQEAVTNVLKHAATDRCRVDLAYAPDALRICVSDDGQGYGHVKDGHGLVGMRERVGMYGGQLNAGPVSGGGFRVAATFPLTAGSHP
jgi:signal transduction histidine kinase